MRKNLLIKKKRKYEIEAREGFPKQFREMKNQQNCKEMQKVQAVDLQINSSH